MQREPAPAGDTRIGPVSPSDAPGGRSTPPRLIAFYLPQFHPIPENDIWWGKGFTEWTNVAKARPLFDGHYQPHLPADFGFYDLRVAETRRDQIRTAREYGIDGFCYHYYWFSGKQVLERPLEDMLADPESDMPFCLCWANENWTRRWDAAEHEVLLEQRYAPEDDERFIAGLLPYLSDPRYIRLDGAPLLVVYRPQQLPAPERTVATWRRYCAEAGVGPLHLCAALTHGNRDYLHLGFDSGVEFPPHNLNVSTVSDRVQFHAPFQGNVLQYADIARQYLGNTYPREQKVFRTVFPSWDNTARVNDRALIVLNGTPRNYEYWLSQAIRRTVEEGEGEKRLVFINAWNEWAEGCHLEPDREYGRAFLEATLAARGRETALRGFTDTDLPSPEGQRVLSREVANMGTYWTSVGIGRLRAWVRRHPRVKGPLKALRSLVTRGRA